MLGRPNGQGGQSRSKWTAAAFMVWTVGGQIVGLPEDIIKSGAGILGGLFGIFLRDSQR